MPTARTPHREAVRVNRALSRSASRMVLRARNAHTISATPATTSQMPTTTGSTRQHSDGIERPKKHHDTGNHTDKSDEDEPIPVSDLFFDSHRYLSRSRKKERDHHDSPPLFAPFCAIGSSLLVSVAAGGPPPIPKSQGPGNPICIPDFAHRDLRRLRGDLGHLRRLWHRSALASTTRSSVSGEVELRFSGHASHLARNTSTRRRFIPSRHRYRPCRPFSGGNDTRRARWLWTCACSA